MLGALVVVLGTYTVRGYVIGAYHDEEMDTRGLGGLTNAGMRHFFAWMMRPLWKGLAAVRVPPNAVTLLNLGLSLTSGLAASVGHFGLAGWLFVGGGALDFLDGRLARATGQATQSGAALDSVVDRYSESALLAGLCWYYGGTRLLIVSLLALTGSLLVPYVRARGEALGATMTGVGVLQRPERVLVLGLGVALAPSVQAFVAPNEAKPLYHLAGLSLAILAVLSHWTAAQRLVHLTRMLRSGTRKRSLGGMSVRTFAIILFATVVDYATMQAFVATHVLGAPAATGLACFGGGLVALAASWNTFAPKMRRLQLTRAGFVSATSAAFNMGGVAVCALLFAEVDHRIAWLGVRLVVVATWNLPLFLAFRAPVPPEPAPRAALPARLPDRAVGPRIPVPTIRRS